MGGQGMGTFSCEGAVLDDVPYAGVRHMANGGSVGPFHCEDVVVRHARGASAATFGGAGIVAGGSSDVSLSRILVEDNEGDGVYFDTSSVGTCSDLTTRRSGMNGGFGAGVTVNNGSEVTLSRAIIEDEASYAVFINASTVHASDVYISGAGSDLSLGGGGGGLASTSSTFDLSRAVVTDTHFIGVDIAGAGASTLEDLVVRNTSADPFYGYGIPINTDASGMTTAIPLTLRRTAVDGGYGTGITGSSMDLVLEDVSVTGIQSLAESGAASHVGEQDRDLSPQLAPRPSLHERGRAVQAELRALRVLFATRCTSDHRRRSVRAQCAVIGVVSKASSP
jgi:hypothetical protein